VPYLPAYSLLLPLRPLPVRGRSFSSRLSPTPTRQGPLSLPLLFSPPLPVRGRLYSSRLSCPLLPVRGHSCPSCSPPALSALALRSLPVRGRSRSSCLSPLSSSPCSPLSLLLLAPSLSCRSLPLPPSLLPARGHSHPSCLSPRIRPHSCDDPTHFCPLAPFALGRQTRGRFAPVPCLRPYSLFRSASYPPGALPLFRFASYPPGAAFTPPVFPPHPYPSGAALAPLASLSPACSDLSRNCRKV